MLALCYCGKTIDEPMGKDNHHHHVNGRTPPRKKHSQGRKHGDNKRRWKSKGKSVRPPSDELNYTTPKSVAFNHNTPPSSTPNAHTRLKSSPPVRDTEIPKESKSIVFKGRKRELPTLKFVYPQAANGASSKAFSFESGCETCRSSPLQQDPILRKKKKVTIDDIFNGKKKACPAVNGSRSPYLSGVSVEEAVQDKVGLRPRCNSTDGELELPQRGLCDERKVLETFQWEGSFTSVPRGFRNLGNTCFLNSTLQFLSCCPPFCQSILSLTNNNGDGKSANNNPGKRISHIMGTLFRQVYPKTKKSDYHFTTASPITPRTIVDILPSLGSIATRYGGYKFRPGRQEDAHEFLIHLLDAMHDGELRSAGIQVRKSGWRDRLPVPRLDETTFVHRVFGGYLRSQVQCTLCGYRSNTYDPFLDLSLEIRKNCNSINAAFHEYTRKETLDVSNRWKCDGCKKRVCATKQLTVFRPPLALIIQVKRFAFGGTYGGNKISRPISYQAAMKLPLSDSRSCEYGLTGAVMHVGNNASSGHYTACVKKPDGRWYLMDDAHSRCIREKEALGQRNAYLLIYSRLEVKIEFPSPPLRSSMTAAEARELAQVRSQERMLVPDEKPPTTKKKPLMEKQCPEPSREVEKPKAAEPDNGKAADKDDAAVEKRQAEPDRPRANIQQTQVKKEKDSPPSPDPSASASEKHGECGLERTRDQEKGVADATKPPTSGYSSSSDSDSSDSSTSSATTLSSKERNHAPEKRKSQTQTWKPTPTNGRSDKYDLLGNAQVDRWGEPDISQQRSAERQQVMQQVVNEEGAQKRRMYLDRHDVLLDEGKVKKVKNHTSVDYTLPNANRFQSIQEDMARMHTKGRSFQGKSKTNPKYRR